MIESLYFAFIDDESGVTAIEYGLIAGLIAMAIAAGASVMGSTLSGFLEACATVISGLPTK